MTCATKASGAPRTMAVPGLSMSTNLISPASAFLSIRIWCRYSSAPSLGPTIGKPARSTIAVKRSCEIKAWVVGQDEREGGIRAILNFGHTFGHAIEAGLGFGEWLHGEAVGCGMVMASHLSQRLGLVDEAFVSRFTALIERAGLPIVGPKLGADEYLHHMRVDKKAEAGEIKFVLIDKPGTAIVRGAPDALVAQVIDDCCER